ncbi:TPM domain-containing protein [Paracoccus shanxieyensis]|uniref:TPM domain-containing protein n=1 Tax=Paracoccus shanxieyensis TaxID=2675752 RepID=A0A6L6J4N8_9RHOB|nr:TPM domain-containing protein [Paracoccus shanxieyensis]MTH65727.1 TPM domain-containing protein [Paracoccus shanxieyensis]MTH88898.1 TPM domain-containing protein [Paracoccus shanxieyensis]
MRHLLAALLVMLGLAAGAAAQNLPEWQSTTVNDLAGLLSPADATAIDRALAELSRSTGVQGTVVTLSDRARYGGADGLEPFATRLFNHWGVGDAQRNDGFMLLVLRDDREARIELGRGYSPEADILAQDIMRGTLLPAMRGDAPSQGIRQTTEDIIRLIVRPVAAGAPLARERSDGWVGLVIFGAFGAIFAAIARKAWTRRRCPECSRSGVTTTRQPHREAQPDGGYLVAQQEIIRRCPHCGWHQTRLSPNPQMMWYGATGELLRQQRNNDYRGAPGQRGPGGGFGGGSSRGGGASGRW